MLNPDYRPPERPKFDPLPEDIYQAVIEDINPIVRKKYQTDEDEDALEFKFVVLDEGDYKGRRFWHRASPYISEPGGQQASWLYLICTAAMKQAPTKEQLESGILTADELNGLIGKQVRCSLKVKTSAKGNQRNALDSILSAKTEMPAPKLETKRPEASSVGSKQVKDEDIPVIEEGEETGGNPPSGDKDLPF